MHHSHPFLLRSGSAAPSRLTPLMLALLAAFPLEAGAQTSAPRPPAPAISAVPKPLPGWLVNGSVRGATGLPLPDNRPNAAGGVDQSINQTSTNAIYNWGSFDIGSASSVTFNFPSVNASALNRVTGSASPSQIFGSLRSQYANPDPTQAPLVGGSIYLVNANGILFGPKAQVNVGSLIASTLDLQNSDYLSGLTNSISGGTASFSYSGDPLLFTDANNYVAVSPGATITTASGGRVFLFAKNVQNAGTITTPDGQTVLAGGGQVFLNVPTAEPIYASEANPAYPVLRGLLVEVGPGSGSAANIAGGVINTPRGNTTLVGMAVNQSGRVSATTSVSENGSVLLLAQGDARVLPLSGSTVYQKEAATGGALTLGPGSVTQVTPDTSLDATGQVPTSSDSSVFNTSYIALAGKTIDLQPNASVVAHGGDIVAHAAMVPNYNAQTLSLGTFDETGSSARVVIEAGASIDASGTDSTTVSVARNFVTTGLLGAADLAGAPLQKSGPLYRSTPTFDLRSPVPILGSTAAYSNAIQRSVEERLSSGGKVSITSTGAVVANPTALLDVAGGQVTYTSAMVTPSLLVAADGSVTTLNNASPNVVYTAIEGRSPSVLDRWGVVPNWTPAQVTSGHVEPGYVQGSAGGTLSIAAPTEILDGKLVASTVAGARQQSGQDALASAGKIQLGSAAGNASTSAVLGDLTIAASTQALPPSFWSDPVAFQLPSTGRVAASAIDASGAGSLTVTANGNLVLEQGADLNLAPGSTVALTAAGSGGLTIGGSFRSIGGSFSARTYDFGSTPSGGLTLLAGQRLDVSGDWQNHYIDGGATRSAYAGGSVSLKSAHGLDLQDSSVIDVSGGATVSASGGLAGSSAGSIALVSDGTLGAASSATFSHVHIGSQLKGNSLGGGGSLSIQAADISIQNQNLPLGIADGLAPGSLTVAPSFFTHGAFTSYSLTATDPLSNALSVASGTAIAPRATNWLAPVNAKSIPTGTSPSSVLSIGSLPQAQRQPVSLQLTANYAFGAPTGSLTLGRGAQILVDAGANVALTAGLSVDVEGSIVAPGGKATVALAPISTNSSIDASTLQGMLQIGNNALIDVSGTLVPAVPDGGPPRGTLLSGGSIAISGSAGANRYAPVVVLPGARLSADGASAQLAVDVVNAQNNKSTQIETVASDAGSITVTAANGGAVLAGTLHATGGSAQAVGGKFSLNFVPTGPDSTGENPRFDDNFERVITVQQGPVTSSQVTTDRVAVSAQAFATGFADVSLVSAQRVDFAGNVSLTTGRSILIDAPAIQAFPNAKIQLSAPTSVQLGGSPNANVVENPFGGAASLQVNSGLVELFGNVATQGFGSVNLKADSEIRLNALPSNAVNQAQFETAASVTFNAPQVSVTTNSAFTIDAPHQSVTITGGDANSATPLSAGGSVTINATQIVQDGVLRAPFGSLSLNGSESVVLGPNSVTSVSGAGLVVPYGSTSGGTNWSLLGQTVTAPPAKAINLNAPGQSVNIQAGAQVDLSGGGSLLAREFVPGIGGPTDVFAAGAAKGAFAIVPGIGSYAPQDADLQLLANNSGTAFTPGNRLSIGAGGPAPAGTYAVLPPEYATLPGAFLVVPVSGSAPLAIGAHVAQADGSTVVGGQVGSAGTAYASSVPRSFQLIPSKLALQSSEIDQTDATSYFANAAKAAGLAAPSLPIDAGHLNIVADTQSLKGTFKFDLPNDPTAVGGTLDIAASNISIGEGTTSAPIGVLNLSASDLNAIKASTLVIGGSVSNGSLSVTADSVVLNNPTTPLKAADVVIAANESIQLKPGASVQASGSVNAPALKVSGDGALLRLTSGTAASTVRTGTQGLVGDLSIGAGAILQADTVQAEATHSTLIASDAHLVATNSLIVGASRMAIGTPDPLTLDPNTLVLAPSLLAELSQTHALTLKSFGGIDLTGSVSVGGAALASLTLDTGTLHLANADVTLSAGGLQLINSSGAASSATKGTGTLQVHADGQAGGSGVLTLAGGAVGVDGAASTTLEASQSVALAGTPRFSVGGDLLIQSPGLVSVGAVTASVGASGAVRIDSQGAAAPLATGNGAHVAISGTSLTQSGNIVMPGAALSLQSTGTGAGSAISFGPGSVTDVSGTKSSFDGTVVATSGGDLQVSAPSGNVVAGKGSLINVSAPDVGTALAGSIQISAPAGSVSLDGRIRAVAASSTVSGSLSVDSLTPLDLGKLSATLANEASASNTNVGGMLTIRNRTGDQLLPSGANLNAHQITLESDAGALTVAGTVTASGGSAPVLNLAGGSALALVAGGQVAAHGDSQAGGTVELMSGISSGAANGQVELGAGTIDLSSVSGDANGKLLLRAQLTDAGDVRIGSVDGTGAIGTQILGATNVTVEGVRRYSATTVDATLINKINTDNLSFAGADGSQGTAILSRLAGANGGLQNSMQLRSGVEVDSTGNLLMKGDPSVGGWNLTAFDANGLPLSQPSGAPVNLTLRAAGNLVLSASISDGFAAATAAGFQTPQASANIVPLAVAVGRQGSDIALVGGADLSAANPMSTVASSTSGDVTLGSTRGNVIVRTTTGSISVAAGRDVSLLNPKAVIYTSGNPVDVSTLGYVGNKLNSKAYISNGGVAQSQFLQGGGSISVAAARDVTEAIGSAPQEITDWLWTSGDTSRSLGSPQWYSRYDAFQEGFATFGGGNVSVSAGRNASDVNVSAATSAFVPRDAAGLPTQSKIFGGGNVQLTAGADVTGGVVFSGRGSERVRAGGNIEVDAATDAGLNVIVGLSSATEEARGHVDAGLSTPFGLLGPIQQFPGRFVPSAITGTAPGASLSVTADSGDLNYVPNPATYLSDVNTGLHKVVVGLETKVIPDNTTFAAPQGSISLNALTQAPATDGMLNVLAGSNASLANVTVAATNAVETAPTLFTAGLTPYVSVSNVTAALDASQRSPVRVVAAAGDLDVSGAFKSVRPARLIAGNDLTLSDTVSVQQQSLQESTLLQAGRDISFASGSGGALSINGPGDVAVIAGRNLDLGAGFGITALGNRQNASLPGQSATLTVLAGVTTNGLDGNQAAAWYFPLLGGTGVAGYGPDLAAQLQAVAAGNPLPGLGSAAAASYAALPIDQQVALVQKLCGTASFDSTVLVAMRRLQSNGALDSDAALKAFGALSTADKSTILDAALANAWVASLKPADQIAQALNMAAALGDQRNHLAALEQFVAQVTNTTPTAAQAVQEFSALSPEQRFVFTSQVLADELRADGRAASAATGTAQTAAYAQGYAAINTVFPELGGTGNVSMGSSEIQTLQDSSVSMLTPRGGIDVGSLSALTSKSASMLGVITGAGGDINMVVKDSVAVNQSRVFTVGKGDLLIWASDGNIDAGRGGKTVVGAPPPLFRLDSQGNFTIDTSGSFSGSGIAVLNPDSTLDLYAPTGAINTGDAGIKSLGNAFFGAAHFIGADNLSVSGTSVGAPPPASTGGDTAGLGAIAQAAVAASPKIASDDSEDEKERKRRRRLNLVLDFLGFGDGSTKP